MDTSEIKAVIQNYFSACYESDGERFREVLHEAAHVYGRDDAGKLNDRDKEDFINLIETGKADRQKQDFPRHEEILSIDFTGEDTAVACVKVRVREILYTDVLSFIRLNGKWMIISKLYSGVPV